MKGEGMDKVREALPELPASQAFSLTRSIYTADDMHAYARAALASQAEKHAAELAKLRQWRDVADDMLTVVHEVASDDPRESIVPAVTEFCCEHAWSAAKQLAWKERDLSCDCDHNEYCQKCLPLEFRAGGKWDKYAAAPHPAAKGGAE